MASSRSQFFGGNFSFLCSQIMVIVNYALQMLIVTYCPINYLNQLNKSLSKDDLTSNNKYFGLGLNQRANKILLEISLQVFFPKMIYFPLVLTTPHRDHPIVVATPSLRPKVARSSLSQRLRLGVRSWPKAEARCLVLDKG